MFIVIMGVSGCGKTTVGKLLAERLGWTFYDGDDYHPAANIAKMSAGIPLNDEDRTGWLQALGDLIGTQTSVGSNGVLACSALKETYRQRLRRGPVLFVYLKGDYETLLKRMQARGGHFMKPAMLQSQFATLEEPTDALTLDVELPPPSLVDKIVQALLSEQ